MFIVREVLIAKPGSAGKLAKLMKESMKLMPSTHKKSTVMLDFVTDFNKIVVEHETESLAEFEKEMNDYKKNPDPRMVEMMKGYTDLYLTGYREIYKVVD